MPESLAVKMQVFRTFDLQISEVYDYFGSSYYIDKKGV
jgi:hypothetical protein